MRHTVVYVDHDRASRELLVELFRLLPELELVTASDVGAARAAIVEHRPAVVVSDAWFGTVSAEGLVVDILGSPRLDAPAVVILSADANTATVERFRRVGVSSYLSKPSDLGHLSEVVLELARGTEVHHEGNGSSARTNAASGN